MINPTPGVGGTCFKLAGDWDFSRRDELQAMLQSAEALDDVTLDLSEITFLDASVLGTFIRLRNRVLKHNSVGRVRIVAASRAVVCLFTLCDLRTMFGLPAPVAGLVDMESDKVPMIRGTVLLSA